MIHHKQLQDEDSDSSFYNITFNSINFPGVIFTGIWFQDTLMLSNSTATWSPIRQCHKIEQFPIEKKWSRDEQERRDGFNFTGFLPWQRRVSGCAWEASHSRQSQSKPQTSVPVAGVETVGTLIRSAWK